MSVDDVVIVGAGHAGVQTAVTLRKRGFEGRISLVGADDEVPYQRPPLSKTYLEALVGGEGALGGLLDLQPESAYEKLRVHLLRGREVTALDRDRRLVHTSDGEELRYDKLVLATGARPRTLDPPEEVSDRVVHLRTKSDTERLARLVGPGAKVAVLGGGFIGLEAASVLSRLGVEVQVFDNAPRVLNRGLSTRMADHLVEQHRRNGVSIHTDWSLERVTTGEHRPVALFSDRGDGYECDLVLTGIGVLPETGLARAAGLTVDDGVVVDGSLRTSDGDIYAIGDCARFPSDRSTGGSLRLESVQNATEQAKHVGNAIATGQDGEYESVPTFWTEHWGLRVQMAGIVEPGDELVVSGEPDEGAFSVLAFRHGRLVAVESVDRPIDHLSARRILGDRENLPSARDLDAYEYDLTAWSKRSRESSVREVVGRT
ncbi:FAD-dependent oxidoreductase [Nocardiopsis sp. ATB16-24]|uniref:NAD(P)/FAD-dependent oxidoreductase n=1 Tax=Nocardiopsis sp. ATB16-24 TaxID=3019555 RepID=UPI002554897D|nr:FAD-dependent oxidoreductase [Nocardiopsis sp. ATB16-24]